MSFIVEQADGGPSTGYERILDIAPEGAAPARAGDSGVEERGGSGLGYHQMGLNPG